MKNSITDKAQINDWLKWMGDEGYTGTQYSQTIVEVHDGRWYVWMNSIESSSSWHGCGVGSTLEEALSTVDDHTGNDCACAQHPYPGSER